MACFKGRCSGRWPSSSAMEAHLCLSVLLCASFFFTFGSAYRHGDIVPMQIRSSYGQSPSDWSQVIARNCPRFRYSKTVALPNFKEDPYLTFNSEFKMSFAFGPDNRHITPWITLWKEEQRVMLNFIHFTFVYSGSDIKEIKWTVDYNDEDEHKGKKLESIFLRFDWEEYGEQNLELGVNSLLLGSVVAFVGMFFYVLIDYQLKTLPFASKADAMEALRAGDLTPMPHSSPSYFSSPPSHSSLAPMGGEQQSLTPPSSVAFDVTSFASSASPSAFKQD
ncbi:hypothetical protein QOT17_004324 [Balamuthia mandrillaris]